MIFHLEIEMRLLSMKKEMSKAETYFCKVWIVHNDMLAWLSYLVNTYKEILYFVWAIKNVSKTPLAGGQWTKKDGKYELVIVGNPEAPQIPIGGKLKLLN